MGERMASIDITAFAGMTPKIAPHLLPNNYAQDATNCVLDNGQLKASKNSANFSSPFTTTTRKSIYFYNKHPATGAGYWFQRDTDVDWVRGPIANDNLLRTYFTGDGVPKLTFVDIAQGGSFGDPYPLGSRSIGIAAPTFFNATGPDTEIEEVEEEEVDPTAGAQIITTSYVMTYVSDLGEEGPPSPATPTVDRFDGGTVALSAIPVPSGDSNITHKRIYRIELNGVFQFVAEIAAATTSYNDSVESASLGEPLPSEGWIAPHEDMIGLTALPNGILAGFWGNTLAFCEPFMPHAWPIKNRLALDHNIVGIAVSAYGLVVATESMPYLVAGSTPDAMQQQKLDKAQACKSKRSVVDMGDFVIYASAEGLVAVGGTSAQVLTLPHITEEQWLSTYQPETIHAYRWRDRYLGFYGTGANQKSFTFHPSEGFRNFDESCSAAYLDNEDGIIYLANGNDLLVWQADFFSAPLTWKSKEFHTPASNPIQVCKVDCEDYTVPEGEDPLRIQFYQNGVLKKTKEVTDGKPFRIPVFTRHTKLHVQILTDESTKAWAVNRVQLATSMSEIY